MKTLEDRSNLKTKEDILETVGRTPIVRLPRIEEHFDLDPDLFAKLEFFNPGGSVKDRIGLSMFEMARRKGLIDEGGVIVEPTSGNTGTGLTIASKRYDCRTVFTMPEKMSREKELLLGAFGARVIRTPTGVSPDDPNSYYNVAKAIRKLIWKKVETVTDQELKKITDRVQKLVEGEELDELQKILEMDVKPSPNAYTPNQYENEYNPEAHRKTTGPEILEQLGNDLDYLFAGMGTGGTISGTGEFLKDRIGSKIIGIDPEGSIISLVKRGMDEEEAREKAETYLTEGIGEDLIPETTNLEVIDEIVNTNDQLSFSMARFLAREEGVFAGGSSGSALYGAIDYLNQTEIKKGKALVILPDTGRNYLTRIFDDTWMRDNGFEPDDEKVLEEII